MLSVTKANLSVTADAIPATALVDHFTKTYGDSNPSFSVRYVGFVNGDDRTEERRALAYTTAADASSHVGSYSVTPGGQTSSDYTISYSAGTRDVTSAVLSATADAIPATALVDHFTKTYGDSNPSFSVRYVGFVNGDD